MTYPARAKKTPDPANPWVHRIWRERAYDAQTTRVKWAAGRKKPHVADFRAPRSRWVPSAARGEEVPHTGASATRPGPPTARHTSPERACAAAARAGGAGADVLGVRDRRRGRPGGRRRRARRRSVPVRDELRLEQLHDQRELRAAPEPAPGRAAVGQRQRLPREPAGPTPPQGAAERDARLPRPRPPRRVREREEGQRPGGCRLPSRRVPHLAPHPLDGRN